MNTSPRQKPASAQVTDRTALEAGCAFGPDRGYRLWRYETYGGRVLGRRGGIGNGHHLRPELARLVGHRSDLGVTLDRSDVPDVNGLDASLVLTHGLQIDLRVLLPRVPDKDERQVLIGAEEAPDHPYLVVCVLPENAQAPVLEKQRPMGNAVHVQEIHEHVVDVPGTARHVEDRVGRLAVRAQLQSPVKSGDALKR